MTLTIVWPTAIPANYPYVGSDVTIPKSEIILDTWPYLWPPKWPQIHLPCVINMSIYLVYKPNKDIYNLTNTCVSMQLKIEEHKAVNLGALCLVSSVEFKQINTTCVVEFYNF